MSYVDGFVAAVPTANREIYKKHAEAAAIVFKEHGALKLVECWGDDVPDGKVTSFPMAVKRKDDETVVFSWITWPSRKVRDEGMKKVMADPRLQPDTNPMPFDGKRMIYGGFEMIVEACSARGLGWRSPPAQWVCRAKLEHSRRWFRANCLVPFQLYPSPREVISSDTIHSPPIGWLPIVFSCHWSS
jgi:uncharacterized protein YbaA (DUF1428 family)